MIEVVKEGLLLEPTKHSFESKGVFNPACVRVGNHVHLFYRAWDKHKRSTIGYCKLKGPLEVVERLDRPLLYSEFDYEYSLEDPRITEVGNTYYLLYTAYDGKNVHIAYAESKDLEEFLKKGIISPRISYREAEKLWQRSSTRVKERYFMFASYYRDRVGKEVMIWDKDAFLFPKKIRGKFVLVHRILPDIQVAYFKEFKELNRSYWKNYLKNISKHLLLEAKYWYENRNIGGGCPPIETNKGWLMIYHTVDDMSSGSRIYRASAALLDKSMKVIARLKEPLFSPERKWEVKGNVNNVVFPTGAVVFKKRLYIYYGAADKRIGVVSVSLKSLLERLRHG